MLDQYYYKFKFLGHSYSTDHIVPIYPTVSAKWWFCIYTTILILFQLQVVLTSSIIPQLVLATIPDETYGKSPSIVTENNIKLLFEIQKKVFGLSSLLVVSSMDKIIYLQGTLQYIYYRTRVK